MPDGGSAAPEVPGADKFGCPHGLPWLDCQRCAIQILVERDRYREALELIRDADWTRAGLVGVQTAAAGALAQGVPDA